MDLNELLATLRGRFVRVKTAMPFDQPATKPWFLPLFYFSSNDSLNGGSAHGLLCDDFSFQPITKKVDIASSFQIGDCAYNFFVQNGDEYRADQVKLFNNILYTMSNRAPWHFTKIEASIGTPMATAFNDGKYGSEDGKQLTLTLSPDTIDRMHHTLFSIYRNLLWDNERDVMLLPRNLRQFNMGLILFHPPITFVDGLSADDMTTKIMNRLRTNSGNMPEKTATIKEASNKNNMINGTNVGASKHWKDGLETITYSYDWKNFPYYEKMVAERPINLKPDDLGDTSNQASWWTFIEFRGCELDVKTMMEYSDVSLDNQTATIIDESKDKLVINYKKAYITTCEKFFDMTLTNIPSQFNEYTRKGSFNNVDSHGSQRWNTTNTK